MVGATRAGWRLRAGRSADAVALARVHVGAWRAAYRDLLPADFLDSLDVERRAESWRNRLRDAETIERTMVAVNRRQRLGFCSFGPAREPAADDPGDLAEIYAVYVDAEHWGEGIGGALVGTAVHQLRAAGLGEIVLWVLASNTRGRTFYEHAGWAPDGTRRSILIGDRELDELRYALSSSGAVPLGSTSKLWRGRP